jgi:predicted membrane protein
MMDMETLEMIAFNVFAILLAVIVIWLNYYMSKMKK